jgi:hypothetical protein
MLSCISACQPAVIPNATVDTISSSRIENQPATTYKEEQSIAIDAMLPSFNEIDDFIENWWIAESNVSGNITTNQSAESYSVLIPVLQSTQYKLKIIEVSAEELLFYYIPIDPELNSLEAQRNQIIVQIPKDAAWNENVNDLIADPNLVFQIHDYVYITFPADLIFPSDDPMFVIDVKDYFSFEIRTYINSTDTHATNE